jgi:hypothetical protein
VFTHHKVFDYHHPVYAAHARHFREHSSWVFTVMQREARDDNIKSLLSERKAFGIPELKAQVREPTRLAHLFCNRERRFGEINAQNLAARLGKGHGYVTRTGSYIKDASLGLGMNRLNEPGQAGMVHNRRIRSISLCLLCELSANYRFVVRGW